MTPISCPLRMICSYEDPIHSELIAKICSEVFEKDYSFKYTKQTLKHNLRIHGYHVFKSSHFSHLTSDTFKICKFLNLQSTYSNLISISLTLKTEKIYFTVFIPDEENLLAVEDKQFTFVIQLISYLLFCPTCEEKFSLENFPAKLYELFKEKPLINSSIRKNSFFEKPLDPYLISSINRITSEWKNREMMDFLKSFDWMDKKNRLDFYERFFKIKSFFLTTPSFVSLENLAREIDPTYEFNYEYLLRELERSPFLPDFIKKPEITLTPSFFRTRSLSSDSESPNLPTPVHFA